MEDHSSKRTALVLGASGGIGSALCAALDSNPAYESVIALSRRGNGLDLTDEEAVSSAAARLKSDGHQFDLIINASGALEVDGQGPEKTFREIDPEIFMEAMRINALGAALALKHFAPLMQKNRKAIFATLSARVGSIEDNRLGGWMSYRASKAALNQIVRCAGVEFSRTYPESVVVALHPGTIKTSLTEKYAKGRYTALPDECAVNLLNVGHALTPEQTGKFFDYAGAEIPW